MATTIRIAYFCVVFSSLPRLWTESQFLDIICDSEPFGEDLCEYTEGDIAWFHSEVVPTGEGENFRTAVVWTEGGQNPSGATVPNVDDATPVLDFGPVVVEDDSFLNYIPVELVDDCDYEKDEIFYALTRMQFSGPIVSQEPSIGAGVIINDNDDNYYIEFQQYDIVETIGKFEFKVCRVGVLADDATIEWSTTDATATSSGDDRDFNAVSKASIAFGLGSECESASLDIIPDLNSFEEREVFYIEISYIETSETGCTGKVIDPSRAIVTIHDATTSLFNIKECNYAITEPESGTTAEFKFIIERSGDTTSSSAIEYSTRAVSANSGMDFKTELQTEVLFDDGETEKDASVTIYSDITDEDPETFEVLLNIPTGEAGILAQPSKAVVTIYDVKITRSCASFDSSVKVVLESSGQANLIIRREGNLDRIGIIDIQTEDIDATTESGDYIADQSTVTFQEGQAVSPVNIAIANDNFKEDAECFAVNLVVPANEENAMELCPPQTVVVTIKDDDDCYNFEGVYFRVMEDDGQVEINIERSGYLGKTSYVYVTVEPNQRTNAATNGNDFSLRINSNNRIEFGVNERIKTLIIDITTGDGYEGVEEFILKLDSITSSPVVDPNQIGATNKVTVVIYDDFVCNPPCVNGECVHDNICECPPTFTGSLCQTPIKAVGASFTIVEYPPGTPIVFIDDYNIPTSHAYLALEAIIIEQLFLAFSSLPGFESVTVLGFYRGSVVVDYVVNFAIDSDTNLGDVSDMFNQVVGESALLGDSNLKLSPTDIGDADADDDAGGTLIAIIMGVMVFLLLLLLLLVSYMCLLRYRRRKQPLQTTQGIAIRPYEGQNPNYVLTDGILGAPPLY